MWNTSFRWVERVFQQHREAGVLAKEQTFQVTPTQAELVKYTKNTFYAVKVTFMNQMYDICEGLGEDWYKVRDIITAEQDQPIGPSHLDPIFGLNRDLEVSAYLKTPML